MQTLVGAPITGSITGHGYEQAPTMQQLYLEFILNIRFLGFQAIFMAREELYMLSCKYPVQAVHFEV